MPLPGYLTTIRSSGVYTFEFDQSQVISPTTNTIRLLIGFSKIGPFNTPVFCEDFRFFESVYGERDKSLERRGSYFHLSAEEMLTDSPIIALNLRDLDDELDQSQFISFSTSASEINQQVGSAPVAGYYNRTKFWRLDPDATIQNIDNQTGFNKSLLNFANIGNNKASILVTNRRIQGLDIPAKDWYGEGNVPEFMDEQDYINDYAVNVQIIRGDFTDYQRLSVDPLFGDYFDTNGLRRTFTDANGNTFDGIDRFIQLPDVVVLASFDGVLIPDFLDRNGNDLYIQNLVNIQSPFTGIYCSVDEDAFDTIDLLSGASNGIDFIGNTIESESPSNIDYLSYFGNITENLSYADETPFSVSQAFVANTANNFAGSYTGSGNAVLSLTDTNAYTDSTDKYDTITVYSPDSTSNEKPVLDAFTSNDEWLDWARTIKTNSSFFDVSTVEAGTTNPGVTTKGLVKDVALLADRIIIQLHASNEASTEELFIDGAILDLANDVNITAYPSASFIGSNGSGDYLFSIDSPAGIDFNAGTLSTGDEVEVTGNIFEIFNISNSIANGNADALDTLLGADILSHNIVFYTVDAQTDILSPLNFKSLAGSINETFTVTKVNDYEFTIDNTSGQFTGKILPEDFLIRGFSDGATFSNIDPRTGKSRFSRIVSVKEDTVTNIITVVARTPIFFGGANNDQVERYKSVDNFVTNYQFTSLDGFSLREAQMPNGTDQRQQEILNVLSNTGLRSTLIDKEAITFRYIIDSFEGTIEPNTKSVLSEICKSRQFAFAILNSPSVKALSESTNPLFRFDARSTYDPRFVSTGGNQQFNPSNNLTLPTIELGANYAGYFHPNLILREGNSVKSVPPAAYVSNNFMAKFRNANPYVIVAGPRRGIVAGRNITGVEYAYDRDGLDELEPFGINVIVPTRGIGLVINSNQTAQQTIQSALSKIHVRELLIFIEEQVEQILRNYRMEFNTVQTRLEIKTLVDGLLSQIQNDQGLFAFETVMNSTNNTPEIIDQSFGIIDIAVEPVRGLERLVQRVTILRTGGIARGEFQIQA